MKRLIYAFFISSIISAGFLTSVRPESRSATVYLTITVVGNTKSKTIPQEDIVKAVKEHIDGITRKNGGYYPIYDPKKGKSVLFKPVNMDEEKVAYLKDSNMCFACVEFVADDGAAIEDGDFCMWMELPENKEIRIDRAEFIPRDSHL